MDCCQCKGFETVFNEKQANSELRAYREHGPAKTTTMLIEALKAERIKDLTLLDIGGGVGAIQHELLRAGVDRSIDAEASGAYVKAVREEAARQGHEDRIRFYHGNFVELAPEIPACDVVTLDRVICCYYDMPALVGLSAARARKLYGLVYPRYTWWTRAGMWLGNLYYRMTRNPFRGYVHNAQEVDRLVRDQGFQQRFFSTSGVWQVVVYAR